MTPFDIRDEVVKIKRRRQVSRQLAELDKQRLYATVLKEIAGGSLDPRSLAMAALEAENE